MLALKTIWLWRYAWEIRLILAGFRQEG